VCLEQTEFLKFQQNSMPKVRRTGTTSLCLHSN
jgi:hypothetical protein